MNGMHSRGSEKRHSGNKNRSMKSTNIMTD